MKKKTMLAYIRCAAALVLLASCGRPPLKQYYMLNYAPSPPQERMIESQYPYVIRLKEFSIEEAYNRSQIVYRLNPYELRYYNFRLWAVKPTRMITDLMFKHLNTANLTSAVIRRFDEGRRPDFELSGIIEALEEYDSEDLIFAHIAMRVNLTRLSDGANVYSRHFDLRKKIYRREPEHIIREMSLIIEYIFSQVIKDLDSKLADQLSGMEAPRFQSVNDPVFISDTE
ncbi:MAG: PqiC family protein [Chitinispirillales bacterium]|nr:PqiC family protein [Chitinispirillales bacterium]